MSTTRDTLIAHGLRCTRQRESIYDALKACRSHPTADELKQLVPGASTATVYNTLEALCSAGLCTKLVTDGAAARFDADQHEHTHIVLEDGRIVDVPDDLSEMLSSSLSAETIAAIESRMGVRVQDVRIELHGTTD